MCSTLCAAQALPEEQADLPSREVSKDCSALLHADIPPGRKPSLPCWADRLRSPQGLTAGQCQTKLPEPDRGADLYLDLPPLSEEHSLPLFLIFI